MTSLRHNRSTEERVLAAARDTIISLGWEQATLTEVARRAGVSRMTVYRRWGDMARVLGDVLTLEWQELLAALPSRDNSTAAGLAATATSVAFDSRENPLFRRILADDAAALLPYLRERPGRSGEMLLDALVGWITAGQAAGTIRAGDPAGMARAMLLTSYGFHFSVQIVGSLEAMRAELEDMLLRYLLP